jgi:hypothetical protein
VQLFNLFFAFAFVVNCATYLIKFPTLLDLHSRNVLLVTFLNVGIAPTATIITGLLTLTLYATIVGILFFRASLFLSLYLLTIYDPTLVLSNSQDIIEVIKFDGIIMADAG